MVRVGRWICLLITVGWTLTLAACGSGKPRGQVPSQHTDGSPRGSHARQLGQHALVYVRVVATGSTEWFAEVLWRPLGRARDERALYRSHSSSIVPSLPQQLGFLPSADGRYLLLWESEWQGQARTWRETAWAVVSVPSGRLTRVAQEKGFRGLLPYWLDGDRVALEQGEGQAIFDTRTGRLTQPLPPRVPALISISPRDVDSPQRLAQQWRHRYLQRHYPRELQWMEAELPPLASALGLSAYLAPRQFPAPDSVDDLLLRPLGIADLSGYLARKAYYPGIALSPDGQRLARTTVRLARETSKPRGESERDARGRELTYWTAEARLDVHDTDSGEHRWGRGASWRLPVAVSGGGPPFVAEKVAPHLYEPSFADVRWSGDGRYLSSTLMNACLGSDGRSVDTVYVWDALTWTTVVTVAGARDGFVVPQPAGVPRAARNEHG